MSSHQKPIELVTLGRPFRLGMLYDIRSDALIPGLTLWDSQKLKENTTKTDLASTNYEVITQGLSTDEGARPRYRRQHEAERPRRSLQSLRLSKICRRSKAVEPPDAPHTSVLHNHSF